MSTARMFLGRSLPYGFHTLADGSKIYFDRKYRPLAHVLPNDTVILKDPSVKLQHHPATFFHDGNSAPHRRLPLFRKLSAIADELGLMPHIKKRARSDYEEFYASIHLKPRRTRVFE